jgi:ribosomal protein L20
MCATDKTLDHWTDIDPQEYWVSSYVQVYHAIWRKTHYDVTNKNNNFSSEVLDRHYHKYSSSSYRTHWNIRDNVCLDLQNCCYSLFIEELVQSFVVVIIYIISLLCWHVPQIVFPCYFLLIFVLLWLWNIS